MKKRKSEKTKGHEIDGYIFGKRKAAGDDVHYRIKFININTTSCADQNSVRSEDNVRDLKRYLFESIFPKVAYLGTFHTHPYRLRQSRGEGLGSEFFHGMYQPSDADIELGGEDGQLDLILAMANGHKKLRQGLRYANNCEYCVQFDIETIRFFIAAYVRNGENGAYYPYCDVSIAIPVLLTKLPENYNYDHLAQLCKI